jgi:hypothetical protein
MHDASGQLYSGTRKFSREICTLVSEIIITVHANRSALFFVSMCALMAAS